MQLFGDNVLNDGVHDISNEEYHAAGGVSRSRLMLFDRSPFHFWYSFSGEKEQKEATDSKLIGAAFHTLLLEPELFDKEYCIKPKLEKLPPEARLKDVGREQFEASKQARKEAQERNRILTEAFEDSLSDKIALTDDQFQKAFNMVEHVKKHDIVFTLIDDAVFEKSIFWTDKETGIQFKARPDIWSDKMIVDLKTTKDAAAYKFQRSAVEYGYYLQAGMAHEACKAIGKPFELFVILAVEKDEPYLPAVYMLDDTALQFGIDQFHNYKRKLADCLSSDKWPAYPVQELKAPNYANKLLEVE